MPEVEEVLGGGPGAGLVVDGHARAPRSTGSELTATNGRPERRISSISGPSVAQADGDDAGRPRPGPAPACRRAVQRRDEVDANSRPPRPRQRAGGELPEVRVRKHRAECLRREERDRALAAAAEGSARRLAGGSPASAAARRIRISVSGRKRSARCMRTTRTSSTLRLPRRRRRWWGDVLRASPRPPLAGLRARPAPWSEECLRRWFANGWGGEFSPGAWPMSTAVMPLQCRRWAPGSDTGPGLGGGQAGTNSWSSRWIPSHRPQRRAASGRDRRSGA